MVAIGSLLAVFWLLAPHHAAGFSRSVTSVKSTDAKTASQEQHLGKVEQPKPIPITVLAGFLGSGKTTLLQSMLQNKEGLRIAVIVNDVASVNIDSKLVKQQQTRDENRLDDDDEKNSNVVVDGMVELQNGCACCSLSDELLSSVAEIVTMSDMRGDENEEGGGAFHHIVVELSGVADPKQIRAMFQNAALVNMPLLERVQLDTFVTVIDSAMFETYFESKDLASRDDTPELYYRPGEREQEDAKIEEIMKTEEEWIKDLPPKLQEAVRAGINAEQRGTSGADEGNVVTDLLVSQTETADVIVLNKIDLFTKSESREKLDQLRAIILALNPRATLISTSYGNVPLTSVLAVAKGAGAVQAGVVDDHRDAVLAAESSSKALDKEVEEICTNPDCTDESHSHSHAHASDVGISRDDHDHEVESSHSHSHSHSDNMDSATEVCSDPACTDESHSHAHTHVEEASAVCNDPECSDTSHSHSHSHSSSCSDPECTDTSHSHSHTHSSSCSDPGCTDTSHSHSHSHSTMAPKHAGIGSFVYRARRPFHPGRLVTFLRNLPVVRGVPSLADLEASAADAEEEDDESDTGKSSESFADELSDETKAILGTTLRSKGFMWSADSHRRAMYWSHAGSSFELSCVGQWWAALPREAWPPEAVKYVLDDFDDENHVDIPVDEDKEDSMVLSSVGDRRQEVVFIGPKFGDRECQKRVCDTLDMCLLRDEEWKDYQCMRSNQKHLEQRFPNPIKYNMGMY